MDVKLKTSELLLRKLAFGIGEEKVQAVSEIRLFSKWDDANRVSLAQAGAVPLLLDQLLQSSDPKIQENSITALLNLSINPQNKALIVETGAGLEAVLQVIKKGISEDAKANGAALLYSLVIDKSLRSVVGSYTGVVKALLELLREGSSKCKGDSLKALFQIAKENPIKEKLVEEQAVPLLVSLVAYGKVKLTEDCLAVLAEVASCPDGSLSLVESDTAIPVIVNVLDKGSPLAQENAAGVLLNVCQSGGQETTDHVLEYKPCVPAIRRLYWSGSQRGKGKAEALLKLLKPDASSYSMDCIPPSVLPELNSSTSHPHGDPTSSPSFISARSWSSKPWIKPAGKYISRAILHRKTSNSTT